jgi:hypothetical protein
MATQLAAEAADAAESAIDAAEAGSAFRGADVVPAAAGMTGT